MSEMTQAGSAKAKTSTVPTVVVVTVLAVVALAWRNDYIISLLILVLLNSLMAQSWNLTIGVYGIWNLGQLAIIAVGGYATGILTVKFGISAWLALPAGAIAGGLAAAIMVLPVVRLRGIYAALLTVAFAEVVRLLIIADHTGLTGGLFGLSGVKGLFDGLSATWSLRAYFWLTLVLSAAVMLLVRRLRYSPFALRGVTLFAGLVAGLAGGLYATFYHGITPSFIGLGPLGLLLITVVVGGLGTVRGPLIGAFVITLLSESLRDAVMWRLIVLGALLVVVLALAPDGLDGLLRRCSGKLRRRVNAGREETAGGAEPGGSKAGKQG